MPTSRITARARPEPAGFTLLEVLLVLGILGLMAALVSARLDTMLPSFRIKAAARELASTVAWYRDNRRWWEEVKSGAYREYYAKQYGNR